MYYPQRTFYIRLYKYTQSSTSTHKFFLMALYTLHILRQCIHAQSALVLLSRSQALSRKSRMQRSVRQPRWGYIFESICLYRYNKVKQILCNYSKYISYINGWDTGGTKTKRITSEPPTKRAEKNRHPEVSTLSAYMPYVKGVTDQIGHVLHHNSILTIYTQGIKVKQVYNVVGTAKDVLPRQTPGVYKTVVVVVT